MGRKSPHEVRCSAGSITRGAGVFSRFNPRSSPSSYPVQVFRVFRAFIVSGRVFGVFRVIRCSAPVQGVQGCSAGSAGSARSGKRFRMFRKRFRGCSGCSAGVQAKFTKGEFKKLRQRKVKNNKKKREFPQKTHEKSDKKI